MAPRVEDGYVVLLDVTTGAELRVQFVRIRREIVDYAVVLTVGWEDEPQVVRVYDGAHGINELHRHTLARGKQPGEQFHPGTLGDGMRDAILQIRTSYEAMIDAWRSD